MDDNIWELEQIRLAIDYYKRAINSTKNIKDKYLYEIAISNLQIQLQDMNQKLYTMQND